MRQLLLIAVSYALAVMANATEIPPQVPLGQFVRVPLNQDERAFVVAADKQGRITPVDVIETKTGIAFTGLPGHYSVFLFSTTSPSQQQLSTEIVGTVPDVKPDPKPDDPPTPKPDDPLVPWPDKAPLPDATGFNVLMLYESGVLPPDIPKEQHEIPYMPTVRDWLGKNTTPSDGWVGWRLGDPDAGVSQGSDLWNRMLKLPRSQVPWLVVNNGAKNKGYSGPMPKNSTDFIKLLESLK